MEARQYYNASIIILKCQYGNCRAVQLPMYFDLTMQSPSNMSINFQGHLIFMKMLRDAIHHFRYYYSNVVKIEVGAK